MEWGGVKTCIAAWSVIAHDVLLRGRLLELLGSRGHKCPGRVLQNGQHCQHDAAHHSNPKRSAHTAPTAALCSAAAPTCEDDGLVAALHAAPAQPRQVCTDAHRPAADQRDGEALAEGPAGGGGRGGGRCLSGRLRAVACCRSSTTSSQSRHHTYSSACDPKADGNDWQPSHSSRPLGSLVPYVRCKPARSPTCRRWCRWRHCQTGTPRPARPPCLSHP